MEMQLNTMKNTFIPSITKMKKVKSHVGKNLDKLIISYIADGNVKSVQLLQEIYHLTVFNELNINTILLSLYSIPTYIHP